MHPKVSVITIVYNSSRFLEQAILSVLNQTYPNVEYIIIDGGSTDGSLNIIKKYASKLAYWTSEKDKGISDAFNKGIAKATGEIIGILNADDWYEPDTVAAVVEKMKEADIVYGSIQLWEEDKKLNIVTGDFRMLAMEMTLNHPTVFVRKSCYDELGVFDTNLRCAMDYDLLLRLKVAGKRFAGIDKVLANMRWGGFSDKQWKLGCRETLQIKNKYLPERRLAHSLYYFKHVGSIRANKFFRKAHLPFIISLYKKLFSPIARK